MQLLEVLAPLYRVDVEDSAITPVAGADPERLRRVRIWNFLEPIAVFGAIMGIIWYTRLDDAITWTKPVLGVLLAWVLVLSPIVHWPFEKNLFLRPEQRSFWFYFFECRGLGSPFKYYFGAPGQRPYIITHWKIIAGLLLFQSILFASACITFHQDMLVKLHEQDMTLAGIILHRAALVAGIDLFLLLVLFPFIVRLDNFHRVLRYMFFFALIVVSLTLIGNLLFQLNEPSLRIRYEGDPYMGLRGETAAVRLASLRPFPVGGQWAGYVFWGFLQQLLFLGVFSVQFSRAFDVAHSRVQRALYCLCSGTCFALIHIPNFWLGIVTFIGGMLAALYFIQCRNLFAFGIAHGLGGTLSNKLLPINFSVGPQ